MGLTQPKMSFRLVREQQVSALLGYFTIDYKVHAFEDQEQNVYGYRHVLRVKFWYREYAWNFDDQLPRYELPVTNES